MKISLVEFGGVAPKIEPRRLADRLATKARNTSFGSGTLGAANIAAVPSTDFTPLSASVRAIIRPINNATRLAFTSDTRGEAFGSLVTPNDKWGRVYYTTQYGPRFTTNESYTAGGLTVNPVSYTLGVRTPQYAPIILGTPDIAPASGEEGEGSEPDIIRSAYVFTYVDKYGHEGAPSPVSTQVSLPYDREFTVELTFMTEGLPDTNITEAVRRVYRATYDGSTSVFQFVGDVPLAMTSWTDNVPLGEEAEALVSTDWVPPPVLKQMAPVASNFMAGFIDNMLCYSELHLPHAWPEQYRYPLKYQIVGMKPTQNGLLIATGGKPYWAFGADPASAVPVELDANHPCLSADSMVDMGGYVIYASTDGLIAVDGQDVKVISDEFIGRLEWLRDFSPASIRGFAYENRYVFSVGSQWWAFDPTDGGAGFSTLDELAVLPSELRMVYYDSRRDTTVLLTLGGQAYDIVDAEGGEFTWCSKVFETPPVSFARARVLSTTYPVSLTVKTDAGVHSYVIADRYPIPLHGGVQCTEWQVEVTGSGRITDISLVQSPEELQ